MESIITSRLKWTLKDYLEASPDVSGEPYCIIFNNLREGLNIYLEHIGTHIRCYYREGKMDGPYVDYHLNEKIRLEGYFKNGNEEGPWKRWYENGSIELISNMVNGKMHGPYTFYDCDGKERRFSYGW